MLPFLHVADPFTNQPQQRSAVQFIVDLLCQADRLESDFLFVNYHQDIIVGLFESLFKAAMTDVFFDDIVSSKSVETVLNLLLRRVRCASRSCRRFCLSTFPSRGLAAAPCRCLCRLGRPVDVRGAAEAVGGQDPQVPACALYLCLEFAEEGQQRAHSSRTFAAIRMQALARGLSAPSAASTR